MSTKLQELARKYREANAWLNRCTTSHDETLVKRVRMQGDGPSLQHMMEQRYIRNDAVTDRLQAIAALLRYLDSDEPI